MDLRSRAFRHDLRGGIPVIKSRYPGEFVPPPPEPSMPELPAYLVAWAAADAYEAEAGKMLEAVVKEPVLIMRARLALKAKQHMRAAKVLRRLAVNRPRSEASPT